MYEKKLAANATGWRERKCWKETLTQHQTRTLIFSYRGPLVHTVWLNNDLCWAWSTCVCYVCCCCPIFIAELGTSNCDDEKRWRTLRWSPRTAIRSYFFLWFPPVMRCTCARISFTKRSLLIKNHCEVGNEPLAMSHINQDVAWIISCKQQRSFSLLNLFQFGFRYPSRTLLSREMVEEAGFYRFHQIWLFPYFFNAQFDGNVFNGLLKWNPFVVNIYLTNWYKHCWNVLPRKHIDMNRTFSLFLMNARIENERDYAEQIDTRPHWYVVRKQMLQLFVRKPACK